jgi:N-acetylmuramoyl-L-alanine amidase
MGDGRWAIKPSQINRSSHRQSGDRRSRDRQIARYNRPVSLPLRVLTFAALVTLAAMATRVAMAQSPGSPYTIVTVDSRKSLPVRTMSGVEMVALDQVAQLFGLALREDTLAGAMSIMAGRQTIVITPGQPAASVAGRVLSLSSPVLRDGRAWFVPVEFLARVLAPATGQRIEIRAVSRSIIVGDIRWPQVAVRLERQGAGVRITAEIQPATPFRLSRDGNRVIAKFDATALDLTLGGAATPELIGSVRADGTSVVIDLGSSASIVRPAEDAPNGRFTVDVSPAPAAGQEAPPPDMRGGLRIVAIDAGHGGEESGARSADGAAEKDIALAIARRLKAAIESRLGLRVVMTREGDDTVPLDRRTAIVNNSQASVLISLHADAAFRSETRGAQILTLSPDDYQRRLPADAAPSVTVPVVGGGSRTIDVVPWDLAQLPHIATSALFATSLEQQLRARQIPMHPRAQDTLPLRLLAGANMPAILLETGFLSNPDDAAALAGGDVPANIIEALILALTDLRTHMNRGGGL